MTTPQRMAAQGAPHPDVALVARVLDGDASAYDGLVRKYHGQVFRIAQRITQNREDAEDIMQESFLKAYQKLERFQGNSMFSTWLVRIAVNTSLSHLRKRRAAKILSIDENIETSNGSILRDLSDCAPNPEQNYTQAELRKILLRKVCGLPPQFRMVFELCAVRGLSLADTAQALGLTIPTVKSRLVRARLRLRDRWGSHLHHRGRAEG